MAQGPVTTIMSLGFIFKIMLLFELVAASESEHVSVTGQRLIYKTDSYYLILSLNKHKLAISILYFTIYLLTIKINLWFYIKVRTTANEVRCDIVDF